MRRDTSCLFFARLFTEICVLLESQSDAMGCVTSAYELYNPYHFRFCNSTMLVCISNAGGNTVTYIYYTTLKRQRVCCLSMARTYILCRLLLMYA